jgi:hypothetical protein
MGSRLRLVILHSGKYGNITGWQKFNQTCNKSHELLLHTILPKIIRFEYVIFTCRKLAGMLQIQRGVGTQVLPSPQYVVFVLDKAASL